MLKNIPAALLYYFVIYPLSLLPYGALYFLSDGMFVFIYRIFGYRKKVVLTNLRKSFPGKTEKELDEIASKFYSHLCDLIIESIKIFSISEKQVQERMKCRNPEVINRYFDSNKSVIIAGGHYNNWELFAVAIDELIKHKAIGIYHPLTNKFFDNKMQLTRSRFGLRMIATKTVKNVFEEEKNKLTATIFAIDQSPSNNKTCYWTNFLNQETAVAFGTEKYSVQYDFPVIFGRLFKTSRGHYLLEFEEACDNPAETKTGEITEKITRMLEQDIIHQPEYWLWSHKRWKLKKN